MARLITRTIVFAAFFMLLYASFSATFGSYGRNVEDYVREALIQRQEGMKGRVSSTLSKGELEKLEKDYGKPVIRQENVEPEMNGRQYPLLDKFQPDRLEKEYAQLLNQLPEMEFGDVECKNWIQNWENHATFKSEYGQDWYLFVNFFRGKRNGFYLDVGANEPEWASNTYFFEKCLGWKGICIEADPIFAKQWPGKRNCQVENVCISDNDTPLKFVQSGPRGHLASGGEEATIEVPCKTLGQVLEKHGVKHVDFMSLDVEGAEEKVLRTLPKDVTIDLIMMETVWSTTRLQWLMSDNSYWRITDVSMLDQVYIRSPMPKLKLPSKIGEWRESMYSELQKVQRVERRCIDGA